MISLNNTAPETVAVAGLGNIGSHCIDLLGRLKGLQRVVLIDPDVYSESNLVSQRIRRADVGRFKARVQAARLAQVNPLLEIVVFTEPIALVPRGYLRDAVLITALDSAEARRDACEAAWRVGTTVIDGGVEPALQLGRVTVYAPGPDSPCFECDLSPEEYDQLPVRHLCSGSAEDAPPSTNGNAAAGAAVGALLVVEAEKILAGTPDLTLAGRQLVVDLAQHRHSVTRLTRNPACRFDHGSRDLRVLAGVSTATRVDELLEAARPLLRISGEMTFGVDGVEFATALHCPGCGSARTRLGIPERLRQRARTCPNCEDGRAMIAVGFKRHARLGTATNPGCPGARTLRSVGVRSGDVLVIGDGQTDGFFEVPA